MARVLGEFHMSLLLGHYPAWLADFLNEVPGDMAAYGDCSVYWFVAGTILTV